MAHFSLDDWAGNGQTASCAVPEDAQKSFWPSRTLSIHELINFADILPSQSKTKNQAWLDGNRSIIYANVRPHGGKHVHYPFWLVVLWGSIEALQNDVIDYWLAAERLHPVPKFGNLKLNPKDVKHQEDLENDLDVVDDPPETVEWLDGENETIDANRTGFDIEDSVDLQSKTPHTLLANSSMQPLEKQKTTEKPMHRNAEMLGVVSWGFE
ncbi:hypothetical protein K439DRAFT_1620014 [Ramaria rubella]|nr:hypothetical protein K439DRAFT_1620014 [Ramaria rubella]